MALKILSARPVVEQTKINLSKRCERLKSRGVTPAMTVVLVGANPASISYVKNKRKLCEEVGAAFNLLHLPESISVEAFMDQLVKLNANPAVHGIIIQLPVSNHLKALNLSNMVLPEKDIDGFHGINTQTLYAGTTNLKLLLPCTPKGIIHLLNFYGIEVSGKNIVIIGRSLIVGKPLAILLLNLNATVTIAHSHTQDIANFTKQADIVISAIGKPHYLNQGYFNPSRHTTVIDVGINSVNGKLVGDVDQDNVAGVIGALSPVPGGVGPMTVLSLIENLITATENQIKE